MMRRSPANAQAAHAEPARVRGRRTQLHRPRAHMLRVREEELVCDWSDCRCQVWERDPTPR